MSSPEKGAVEFGKSDIGILNAQWTASRRYLKKSFAEKRSISAIYHYTDLHGLKGILESRGFWLSEAIYLNDTEELHNGKNLALSLIDSLLNKRRHALFKDVLLGVMRKLQDSTFEDRYVCSFSLKPDSLEQWRAYSDGGSGICIGFDIRRKTHFPHFPQISNFWYYEKVIYDDAQKYWVLLSIIFTYAHWYRFDRDRRPYFDEDQEYINRLSFSLINTFLFFKNKSFSSENEVRLVYSMGTPLDLFKKKHFRLGKDKLIPYIATYDTKLKQDKDEVHEIDLLPVTKIIVGPTANRSETIDSIKYFVREIGYPSDIVLASGIPYRG